MPREYGGWSNWKNTSSGHAVAGPAAAGLSSKDRCKQIARELQKNAGESDRTNPSSWIKRLEKSFDKKTYDYALPWEDKDTQKLWNQYSEAYEAGEYWTTADGHRIWFVIYVLAENPSHLERLRPWLKDCDPFWQAVVMAIKSQGGEKDGRPGHSSSGHGDDKNADLMAYVRAENVSASLARSATAAPRSPWESYNRVETDRRGGERFGAGSASTAWWCPPPEKAETWQFSPSQWPDHGNDRREDERKEEEGKEKEKEAEREWNQLEEECKETEAPEETARVEATRRLASIWAAPGGEGSVREVLRIAGLELARAVAEVLLEEGHDVLLEKVVKKLQRAEADCCAELREILSV